MYVRTINSRISVTFSCFSVVFLCILLKAVVDEIQRKTTEKHENVTDVREIMIPTYIFRYMSNRLV